MGNELTAVSTQVLFARSLSQILGVRSQALW